MQSLKAFWDSVTTEAERALAPDGWLVKLWPLWLLWSICFFVVMVQAPIKAGPALFGISKVLMGGLIGLVIHWGFRRIYPMADDPTGIETGTDWKCCTALMCAAIVALAFVP
ncbi:MAG: hypothetical protein WBN86_10130 [Porticoccaceae bacterium]